MTRLADQTERRTDQGAVATEPSAGNAKADPTTVLAGHLAMYREDVRRLDELSGSIDPDDEARSDALSATSHARVVAATDLPADTVEGILYKLDLWYADHLADGADAPEIEADRLVVSIRLDLARLLRS